jgi:2-keto-3-deoxy-L-rhamnonate aldolase RhmA
LISSLASGVEFVPKLYYSSTGNLDRIVKVEIDWTMIGASDVALYVGTFDPRKESSSDEDVIEASAVIRRSVTECRVSLEREV